MRTTYVVLVLTMLSAASSYGFDIGISGGIRDWEDTAQRSVRPTPTLILSLGEYFRQDLPFRFDAVGGIWTTREIHRTPVFTYTALDDRFPSSEQESEYYRQGNDQSEWPGFLLGLRVVLEPLKLSESGRRMVRPMISLGLLWTAEESRKYDQLYWRDDVTAEGMLGVAIPVGQVADFLVQYAIANNYNTDEYPTQYLTLGYRFSVWSKR